MSMLRMMTLGAAVLAAASLFGGCANDSYQKAQMDGWNHFGPVQEIEKTNHVALGMFSGEETDVVVEGTIIEMCETSGCWAKIADEAGHEVFILCEPHGFHLPKNATGHTVVAHGDGQVRVVPVADQKHFAEVSGATEEEIAQITKPKVMKMLIADSVYIEGADLVKAYTPEEALEQCEAEHGEDHEH